MDPVTSGRYLGVVSSYQRLPGLANSTSGFYIVNTDRPSGSREHWTCLWFNGYGTCDYGDSFFILSWWTTTQWDTVPGLIRGHSVCCVVCMLCFMPAAEVLVIMVLRAFWLQEITTTMTKKPVLFLDLQSAVHYELWCQAPHHWLWRGHHLWGPQLDCTGSLQRIR